MVKVIRKLKPYLKTVTASGATILYAVSAALSDDVVTNSEWTAIITLVLTTFGVFQVPNKPEFDENRAPVEPLAEGGF